MSTFQWKKEYELGHLLLDKEHKMLFEIAQEAFSVIDPSQRKNKIIAVIKKLTNYLYIHFQHEEDYMKSISYPQLHEEEKMHKKTIHDFKEWKNTLSCKAINVIEKELAYGIEKHIVEHIKKEDVKIREWCRRNNVDINAVLWKETYSIGNNLIDGENKRLFKIANKALENTPLNNKKEKIKSIIHDLHTYMKENFTNKEVLMKSINYPSFEEHVKMHTALEEKMNIFSKNIPNMSLSQTEKELAIFIQEHFIYHVIHQDSKLKKFIRNIKARSENANEKIFDI